MAATHTGDSPPNPTTHDDGHDATTATAANRREHVRVRPDDHNQLTATLASGSDIRLIDLSKGGAQFECERRFLPNASVSLRLRTRDGEVLVTGRVVRSRIVRLGSGGLGYLVGVAFAKPLQHDLGEEAAAPAPDPAPTQVPAPVATAASAPVEPPPGANAPVAPTAPAVDAAAVAPDASPVADQAPEASTPVDASADISAEEALAFESGIQFAPAMLTVTASVDTTSDELQDMFNGNDW